MIKYRHAERARLCKITVERFVASDSSFHKFHREGRLSTELTACDSSENDPI